MQPKEFSRLRSITYPLTLEMGEGCHSLEVTLSYDHNLILRELNFVGRGKIGHGLDLLLLDLGIKISRAIQNRDPDSGNPLSD